MKKKKTINDIYNYCTDNNIIMLSEYNSDFWANYITNHSTYDLVFLRLFSSFIFFMKSNNENIEDVSTRFINQVRAHLLINDKKYSELYRVNVIDDSKYSLTDNYDMVETMQKIGGDNQTDTFGQRLDTSNSTVGAQTNDNIHKVAPDDANTFNNYESDIFTNGERTDTSAITKGSEIDTHVNTNTENYNLTRKGNIGVMTATDMLDRHKRFWSMWEFYEYIFKEISRDLLIV